MLGETLALWDFMGLRLMYAELVLLHHRRASGFQATLLPLSNKTPEIDPRCWECVQHARKQCYAYSKRQELKEQAKHEILWAETPANGFSTANQSHGVQKRKPPYVNDYEKITVSFQPAHISKH